MKPKKLLRELEIVAERLGIQTIYDTFDGKGGGCRVVENRYIVINKRLTDEVKAELFLRALSGMPIDEIFIKPDIRQMLEEARDEVTAPTDES
ncbi:hypothetical protein GF359_09205 [candidate division WOR-3 bacterium]|uniref:Uncharacterized protein n=1 Tax=candidate division WOR-3 bacterium TaxID=2052148 RepID=A0A9D5KD13_UNCW3|nr:hypothetical protein [candidate division WOR-3 bacterium]MBD3365376.1 hypothetical protein [candidate division WOR-3 bacterium]